MEMAFALLGMKSRRHKRNVASMDSTPSLPCLVKIIDLNKMSFEDEGGNTCEAMTRRITSDKFLVVSKN